MPGASSYNVYQNGVATSTTSLSRSYTQSAAGTYSYTVSACNSVGCSAQSGAISVTVDVTGIDLIGFDGNYKGYWPTSPSSTDLYVARQNADGNMEGVTDFILVPQPDGSYSLNANPTSGDISQFNLGTPASIAYELADINLDGAMDMVLLNSSEVATGFVYASTNSQSAPIAYKHLDADFVEFFEDVYPGIEDPGYYLRTAMINNWGAWEYGPVRLGWHSTDLLFLSGQQYSGGGPFFTQLSEAYDPATIPAWCANPLPNNPGAFNPVTQVWQIYGYYQDVVAFYPNYSSHWDPDARAVAGHVAQFLATESMAAIPSVITAVLEDILGVDHGLDNEAAIFNLIKIIGQVLWGLGVEQESEAPKILPKVELLYTATALTGVPFVRHAYLQVTYPNGNKYMTRGGPQNSFFPFGNIDTQWFLNPTSQSDFPDHGSYIYYRQLVGFIGLPEATIAAAMASNTNEANSCAMPYKPFTENSNSYAFQSVTTVTGLPRPKAQSWAPGANGVILFPCP